MERIVSKQNTKIKELKKLNTNKGRKKKQQYLLESWHLVQEAINNLPQEQIITIFTTDDQYLKHGSELKNFEVILISEEIAAEIADTSTTQGIFAVCKIFDTSLEKNEYQGAWLLLDDVQDPGNIGTMVRTADAAGFTGVVFGEGTSSQYNSKVLRSMQGSQFHIKLVKEKIENVINQLKTNEVPVYGTELNPEAINYEMVKPADNFALIMGNEGNGMDKKLLSETTENLYIPIKGHAESLNVAVAAAVIMFRIKK
ncbi:RNA methyltransferase [Fructilactobacillus vespulae]|uniref:TrmH family RNA methyltransferase n=1 Tax=Fructilactobacillus vespulae TaxID=1249630 RepID=UPI0039B5770E